MFVCGCNLYVQVSRSAFDVCCSVSRRHYHFTECDGAGSQMWAELVGAMLDKQLGV